MFPHVLKCICVSHCIISHMKERGIACGRSVHVTTCTLLTVSRRNLMLRLKLTIIPHVIHTITQTRCACVPNPTHMCPHPPVMGSPTVLQTQPPQKQKTGRSPQECRIEAATVAIAARPARRRPPPGHVQANRFHVRIYAPRRTKGGSSQECWIEASGRAHRTRTFLARAEAHIHRGIR